MGRAAFLSGEGRCLNGDLGGFQGWAVIFWDFMVQGLEGWSGWLLGGGQAGTAVVSGR